MLGHGETKLNDEFGDSETYNTNRRSRALDADSQNSKSVQSVKRINKNGTTPYKYNDRRMSRQNIPANRSFKLNASSSNSNAAIKPVSSTFVPVPIIASVRAKIVPSVMYSVPVAIAWPHTTPQVATGEGGQEKNPGVLGDLVWVSTG